MINIYVDNCISFMILYKSILYTPAKFKPFDLFVFIDKDRLREVFFPHFFL